MKVLILGDGQSWIVDRTVQKMVEGIPCEFTVGYYTRIQPNELVDLSTTHDLIHYGNWDIARHFEVLDELKAPLLLSIRSHRYYPLVREAVKKVTKIHVSNKRLQREFPGSVYIPDGVDERFKPSEFKVGYAGRIEDYKGYQLVRQACKELGVSFCPATGNLKPEEMPGYYRSLDLYVCASEAEGFSTSVMECLAMNVPVITTDVGVPAELNVAKIERSVEGIKAGISKHHTSRWIWPEFSWENVNRQLYELYQNIVDVHTL